IGIGDGGNEIGMGKLPWEVLRANIVLGGKIACRVPTQHLLVAGTSNWGAYALAAGLLQCRGRTELAHLFEAEREAQLWESVLRREPPGDGGAAARPGTVDGLAWPRFAEPLVAIGKLLRHGPEPVSPRRTQEPGNATS
ncbi:MAG TPA: DUF4392 domain-containing protein, partial [Gemmatales bacterium]|nr:DUF4392 domain-containing protein [Gemmatales bacterium]